MRPERPWALGRCSRRLEKREYGDAGVVRESLTFSPFVARQTERRRGISRRSPSASPTPASASACSSTGRWTGHNGPSPSSGTLAIMVPAIRRDHDRSSRARSSEAVPSSTLSAKLEDQRLGYVRRQRRVSRSLVAQDIHTSPWLSLWWPAHVGCAQCPSRSMSQVAHFLCIRASLDVCDTLLVRRAKLGFVSQG